MYVFSTLRICIYIRMPNSKVQEDAGSKPASFSFGSISCCGAALHRLFSLPKQTMTFHTYHFYLSTMSRA